MVGEKHLLKMIFTIKLKLSKNNFNLMLTKSKKVCILKPLIIWKGEGLMLVNRLFNFNCCQTSKVNGHSDMSSVGHSF